jgi:hypothetical protein
MDKRTRLALRLEAIAIRLDALRRRAPEADLTQLTATLALNRALYADAFGAPAERPPPVLIAADDPLF